MKLKIKNYLSAYLYLQDAYLERKSDSPAFSYDVWAQEMGASDKSYIRMMVLGKRPINAKMAAAFAMSLKLDSEDQKFFLVLLEYTQSKTQEQKNLFGKRLVTLLRSDLDRLEVQAHYDFLSNPLMPRLQVFISFNDVDQSPQNLAWLLGVSEDEVNAGISTLLNLGLIKRVGDRLVTQKKSFNVPDHFGDLGLEAFYSSNLDAAKEAMRLPKEKRRYKSLFLPLNSQEFEKYLSNLQTFVSEQIYNFNPDEYEDRTLYQVHFNIIPVSESAPQQTSAKETEAAL